MEDFEQNKNIDEIDKEDVYSDDVIAICAINATLRVRGVKELSGGIQNTLSENILGKELLSKGIKVEQTERGIILDVNIISKFGYNIPTVAWDIQEAVKKEVETMIENKVLAVNINIQGVEQPKIIKEH